MSTTLVVAGVVALAVLAIGATWLVPRLQARRWKAAGLQPKEVAELENSARGTLVQLLGGAALILTFVATWIQIADTREASERTLDLARAQQESERFTRAVEQLASDKLEVRLGGIYALGQSAQETPGRQAAVAELMMAYLKSRRPLRREDPRLVSVVQQNNIAKNIPGVRTACESTVARPWPDTQAALGVLMGIPRRERGRFDLAGADLVGVQLPGADFRGVDLREASLADADLQNAHFEKTTLSRTDLRRACLRGAHLDGAVFAVANTVGADLRGAETNGMIAYGLAGAAAGLHGALTDDCEYIPKRWALRSECRREP